MFLGFVAELEGRSRWLPGSQSLYSPSCPQVRATAAPTEEPARHWELFAIHTSASSSNPSGFHQKQSPWDAHPHVSATSLPHPSSQAQHPAGASKEPPALSTHLSMRRRHTIPRISTSPLSFSCWHPILVAMKQPVRPMPALQDRHSCAEHRQHPLPTPAPC